MVLFERAKSLGGRARTTEERGYLFNLGPRAIYRRGLGKRVLSELGIATPGRCPALNGIFAVAGGELTKSFSYQDL